MAHFGLSLAVKNVIKAGADRELIKLYDFTGEDLYQLHLKTAKALSRLEFQYCYTSIYSGKDAWKTAFAALE